MVDQEDIRIREKVIAEILPYQLNFVTAARTSRDVLNRRSIYYVRFLSQETTKEGWGECAPIFGLSPETEESLLGELEFALKDFLSKGFIERKFGPAIHFAIETAWLDYLNGGEGNLFPTTMLHPIPINGLVWMNRKNEMLSEAREKINKGYSTIKLKIGGISFEDELDILRELRVDFSSDRLTIRLDANGAFKEKDALFKLDQLAKFDIHSIEQPFQPGNWPFLRQLCAQSSIPIALDEELIGVSDLLKKDELLSQIEPAYIILKPTLHGGMEGCDEWIHYAEQKNIKWWVTSALESSVGLNAIAQWVSTKPIQMPQGLGTGSLYSNNLPAQWISEQGYIYFQGQRTDSIISYVSR